MRLQAILVALTLVLGAGAGCRATTGQSLGTNLNDSQITAEVKRKLTANRLSNLTRVDVETVDGNVSLTGTVETPNDRALAEQAARGVTGVKQVTNNLQVEKK
jgi:osmotically-inducible protein OsmY